MAELLALESLTAGYGEARVLDDVSLALAEGESLALLGRNGAGKTTLLVTLMGLTRVFAGRGLKGGSKARIHFDRTHQWASSRCAPPR